jgi:hypothetical protein
MALQELDELREKLSEIQEVNDGKQTVCPLFSLKSR